MKVRDLVVKMLDSEYVRIVDSYSKKILLKCYADEIPEELKDMEVDLIYSHTISNTNTSFTVLEVEEA